MRRCAQPAAQCDRLAADRRRPSDGRRVRRGPLCGAGVSRRSPWPAAGQDRERADGELGASAGALAAADLVVPGGPTTVPALALAATRLPRPGRACVRRQHRRRHSRSLRPYRPRRHVGGTREAHPRRLRQGRHTCRRAVLPRLCGLVGFLHRPPGAWLPPGIRRSPQAAEVAVERCHSRRRRRDRHGNAEPRVLARRVGPRRARLPRRGGTARGDRSRGPALPPLRDRPPDQPHAVLRDPHRRCLSASSSA